MPNKLQSIGSISGSKLGLIDAAGNVTNDPELQIENAEKLQVLLQLELANAETEKKKLDILNAIADIDNEISRKKAEVLITGEVMQGRPDFQLPPDIVEYNRAKAQMEMMPSGWWANIPKEYKWGGAALLGGLVLVYAMKKKRRRRRR